MPYNSIINRTDAEALIPEEVSREIIQEVPTSSSVMQLARKLPNMSRKQRKMPVLDALISAYFVNGDTGLKQTSEVAWANKYVTAEEMAVIVPIPEAVLEDEDYDIWGEVKPRIIEAFGRAFDAAVVLGTNIPAAWVIDMGNHSGLLDGCTDASHVLDLSNELAAGKDMFDVILGEGGLLSFVEEDGYEINGHVASLKMKAKLRGVRAKVFNGVDSMVPAGEPIFVRSMQESGRYELDGVSILFPKNGAIPADSLLQVSGDWNQLVYSIRTDVTYKILTEAVIQDNTGAIIYNLAQQDMVALRAVMRLGVALPNPINAVNQDAATRFPFSALVP
ncbi:MAG: phage major capsid protein [Chloroflexi bacterium]|nr:phage major capsid protein [Chloroflexota bacterium]